MENKSLSRADARLQVRSEFPRAFGRCQATKGGDFVDGKLPHTLQLVKSSDGFKLKLTVTPKNPLGVTLVAFHYEINNGQSMNFDVRNPEPGTNTYVHVTPDGGGYPVCPPGAWVKYWLAVEVNGLLQTVPQAHKDRLWWTAHEEGTPAPEWRDDRWDHHHKKDRSHSPKGKGKGKDRSHSPKGKGKGKDRSHSPKGKGKHHKDKGK